MELDRQNNFNISKRNFLAEIFSSEKHLSDHLLKDSLEKYGFIKNMSNACFIVIFRICNYKQFVMSNSSTSIDFQLDSVENIALQVFNTKFHCSASNFNIEHVVLIASTPQNLSVNNIMFDKEIGDMCKSIQTTILQLFNLEVVIGVSSILSDINILEIREKYSQAFNLTNYRLILGKNSVFFKSSLKTTEVKNDKISIYLDNAVNAVKSADNEKYKEQLHSLFEEVKCCPYDRIIKIYYQLAESIQQISSNLYSLNVNTDNISSENIYVILKSFEDYTELEEWFLQLYNRVNNVILNIKSKKTQDLIENVTDYIKNNYKEMNLSANLMAEKLSVTPQYFSKLFKEFTGYSFPDFVNNIRLEKATELILSDEHMSVSDICDMVGYNNKPYFTNSFTKKYGVSPTKYKQAKRIIERDKPTL